MGVSSSGGGGGGILGLLPLFVCGLFALVPRTFSKTDETINLSNYTLSSIYIPGVLILTAMGGMFTRISIACSN